MNFHLGRATASQQSSKQAAYSGLRVWRLCGSTLFSPWRLGALAVQLLLEGAQKRKPPEGSFL
jgi:hypothetical protein